MLIQSLFLDRKDELQEMQKVLWHIVDTNKTNADIQIKAMEKLQDLTMILVGYTIHYHRRYHLAWSSDHTLIDTTLKISQIII